SGAWPLDAARAATRDRAGRERMGAGDVSAREPAVAKNGEALDLASVPVLGVDEFRSTIFGAVGNGGRVASFFGVRGPPGSARLYCVIAEAAKKTLSVVAADVRGKYPSLTPDCPQVRRFEAEIAEQCEVTPE